jgi:pimeloyl-ACP methyl ester carboxylesterase
LIDLNHAAAGKDTAALDRSWWVGEADLHPAPHLPIRPTPAPGRWTITAWSLGGFVAQILAFDHPDLVRRLVVTGSGPGGVPGAPELDPRGPQTMTADVNTEEDYPYLVFGERGSRWIGKESLARLDRDSANQTRTSAPRHGTTSCRSSAGAAGRSRLDRGA